MTTSLFDYWKSITCQSERNREEKRLSECFLIKWIEMSINSQSHKLVWLTLTLTLLGHVMMQSTVTMFAFRFKDTWCSLCVLLPLNYPSSLALAHTRKFFSDTERVVKKKKPPPSVCHPQNKEEPDREKNEASVESQEWSASENIFYHFIGI